MLRSDAPQPDAIYRFLAESNAIEGIHRDPTREELSHSRAFLCWPLTMASLATIQAVYAPGMPMRTEAGMNVRVGNLICPPGGPAVIDRLERILAGIWSPGPIKGPVEILDPWRAHTRFLHLHPFMDGNGRTGRILWAWHMRHLYGPDAPFTLPFLHRFYYQTLAFADSLQPA